MANYAKVENGVVTQVIVAESEFFKTFVDSSPGEWIECSGNVGIGFTYDINLKKFIQIQPYTSWVMNAESGEWEAPVTYPSDGKIYEWNESSKGWNETDKSGDV